MKGADAYIFFRVLFFSCSMHPRSGKRLLCDIAVFPILADVVEVKKGSRSTALWSNDFIRLNRWLRNSFAQLITPLDIDSIGQNWEDSNTEAASSSAKWGIC